MSSGGRRPEAPELVALYASEPKRLLDPKSGLTRQASPAFVGGGKLLAAQADLEYLYIKTIMQRRLDLDLAYQNTVSFAGDVEPVLPTARRLFSMM